MNDDFPLHWLLRLLRTIDPEHATIYIIIISALILSLWIWRKTRKQN